MKDPKNILLAIIALLQAAILALVAVMAFKYLSQSNNSPAQPQESECYAPPQESECYAPPQEPVAIEKQVSKRYKIGDLYDVDGKKGVVFEVSADGKHGKIVSLTEPSVMKTWNEAVAWCRNRGDGWYLPSKDELLAIYKVQNKLNVSLKAVGKELVDWFYWSSTEDDEFRAWIVGLNVGSAYGDGKTSNHYVRAVSAF